MPISNYIALESNGAIPVNIKTRITDVVELYMYIDQADTLLSAPAVKDSKLLNVVDASSVVNGHAVTLYSGTRHYQSIIVSHTANSITLASPLDYTYPTGVKVHTGAWNMAVDATVPKIAHIHGPDTGAYDIYQLGVSITDATAMDSSLFGGITALTNGILFRLVNGETRNLPLIVNNLGFAEYGFITEYDAKAPAGVYGFKAYKNYNTVNGAAIRLGAGDNLELYLQDNLSGLLNFNVTIQGHQVLV